MGRINSWLIMNKFIIILSFIVIALSNYSDSWEVRLYNLDTDEYELLTFDMSVGYATCDSNNILIIVSELNNGRIGIILPTNTVWNVRDEDIILKDSKIYHYDIIEKNE